MTAIGAKLTPPVEGDPPPNDRMHIKPAEARVRQDAKSPYYIVAPPYVRTSAGIKVLHYLCDCLNQLGCEAYIVVHPWGVSGRLVSPGLDTPLLSKAVARSHFLARRTPIVVYPETVYGDPLRAPVACRYILNYPGLLGGDAYFGEDVICVGYSERLARAVGAPERVLFIPASSPAIFHPPQFGGRRSGTCFYAAKYKEFHGAELFDITSNSIEITRDKPDSLTPAEIAELFCKSSLFYCYENTSLAMEAAMCGCPAVFLPNPHLTEIIGAEELGSDGFAWGADPADVERASESVDRFYTHYLALLNKFWVQLDYFVDVTQEAAKSRPYTQLVTVDWRKAKGEPFAMVLARRTVQVLRGEGLLGVAQRTIRYVGSRALKVIRNRHAV